MKRNVRIFSMILALLCVISMIPLMTVSATEPAETTETAKYVDLSTYADGANYTPDEGVTNYTVVKTLAKLQENATMSTNIILGADIDCTNQSWSQINLNGHIFDGNGYAIYGIVTDTNNAFGGMFKGVVGTNANAISNLTVGLPEAKIQMTSSGSNKVSGVLLGDVKVTGDITFNFENVTVYADLIVTGNAHLIGGFIGLLRSGTVNLKQCKFYGSIDNNKKDANDYRSAGGFIGLVQDRNGVCTVNFEDCVNYATIKNDTEFAGGFIGLFQSDYAKDGDTGVSTVTIERCMNAGVVSGNKAGGFVGIQIDETNPSSLANGKSVLSISNSLNVGTIESTGEAAGFLGRAAQRNCVTTFTNCVNIGTICASGESAGAAGFVCRNTSIAFDNCGSFGAVTATTDTKVGVFTINTGWNLASAKNLHYVEIATAEDVIGNRKISGYTGSVKMTLTEGIEWINTLLGDTVGAVIMNTDGTGAVLAAPTFAGVQAATVADAEGEGKIRFVATLNDSLRYSTVGFEVTHKETGKTVTTECQSVYTTLNGATNEGLETYTAAELYGTYVFALAIKDIPNDGTTYTFVVTPYGKDGNSTTEYRGDSYEVVYMDGEIVAINACA